MIQLKLNIYKTNKAVRGSLCRSSYTPAKQAFEADFNSLFSPLVTVIVIFPLETARPIKHQNGVTIEGATQQHIYAAHE